MVKVMNAKVKAIAKFLGIALGAGVIGGALFTPSTWQVAKEKTRAEKSPIVQKYEGDVNDFVAQLAKKGLHIEDALKDWRGALKFEYGPRDRIRVKELRSDGGVSVWGLDPFLEWRAREFLKQHPEFSSEATLKKLNELNRRFNTDIKPLVKPFNRELRMRRVKGAAGRGVITGFLTASGLATANAIRRKKKNSMRRPMK